MINLFVFLISLNMSVPNYISTVSNNNEFNKSIDVESMKSFILKAKYIAHRDGTIEEIDYGENTEDNNSQYILTFTILGILFLIIIIVAYINVKKDREMSKMFDENMGKREDRYRYKGIDITKKNKIIKKTPLFILSIICMIIAFVVMPSSTAIGKIILAISLILFVSIFLNVICKNIYFIERMNNEYCITIPRAPVEILIGRLVEYVNIILIVIINLILYGVFNSLILLFLLVEFFICVLFCDTYEKLNVIDFAENTSIDCIDWEKLYNLDVHRIIKEQICDIYHCSYPDIERYYKGKKYE